MSSMNLSNLFPTRHHTLIMPQVRIYVYADLAVRMARIDFRCAAFSAPVESGDCDHISSIILCKQQYSDIRSTCLSFIVHVHIGAFVIIRARFLQ
jgi:hypothetical protein